MRTTVVLCTCLLIWMTQAAPVTAQNRGRREPAMQQLNADVTVASVSPRALQVVTQEGQQWLVTLPTRPEGIVFRGTATTQFLQPGMFVRFHTTFRRTDKRHKEYEATRPVTKLEVVTPNTQPGVYPDEDSPPALDGAGRRDPEDGPAKKASPQAKEGGEQPEKKPAKPPATARNEQPEKKPQPAGNAVGDQALAATADEIPCLVIGLVREYKNNKIKVSAGSIPVTAELPETAEVAVDVRHALWVRPGDTIKLAARFYPALPGRAEGQQMDITATAPLAPDEKASKNRRRREK